MADAGYAAIPFSWDGAGLYQIAIGKIDTTTVDFALDSGMSADFVLDPSLEDLPGIHPMDVVTVAASAYGTDNMKIATLDHLKLGSVMLGPLTGNLHPPIISSAAGMLGAPIFADRAAIFDFATDTLYLLATEAAVRIPAPSPAGQPARSLRAALETAGGYRTFLSLMRTAGLMPLLESLAPDTAIIDSLAWEGIRKQAIHQAGLDTMPDDGARNRLVREALNRRFRSAGRVTVFAPTDAAFAQLAPATLRTLQADRVQLAALLRAHLLTNTVLPAAALGTLVRGASQPSGSTLGFHPLGEQLDVDRQTGWGGRILARATVVQPDLTAVNGVVHGIDRVLLPSSRPSPVAAALAQEGYTAVPIERLPGGLYAVRARTNGISVTLALDTGAPQELMLDEPLAERFGPPGQSTLAVTLDGAPADRPLSLDLISIDLSRVNQRLKLNGSPSIDGLLGASTFVKYGARYDFGTGTLYLRLPPAP